MSGLDNVAKQVAAVNMRFAKVLFEMREMVFEGGIGACKGCGYPTSVASYKYYEMGDSESVTERVCHDCAYPKVGSYLREKEEKRQKEQAEKAKKENNDCSQCQEERAEFWGGDYACNCGAVKPPCRACTHPGNPLAQESGCQHKERRCLGEDLPPTL